MAKGENAGVRMDEGKEFLAFAKEFTNESDRAAVVLGAAKLDQILFQVLQKFLVPNPTSSDDFLEGDSPLGTFSSRIKAAYRLGLIDSEFARALHMVRRIRNAFAHELHGVTLTSGAHRDRVRDLAEVLRPMTPQWKDWLVEQFKPHTGASEEFRVVVALLAQRLAGLRKSLTPLSSEKVFKVIPPQLQAGGSPPS